MHITYDCTESYSFCCTHLRCPHCGCARHQCQPSVTLGLQGTNREPIGKYRENPEALQSGYKSILAII